MEQEQGHLYGMIEPECHSLATTHTHQRTHQDITQQAIPPDLK